MVTVGALAIGYLVVGAVAALAWLARRGAVVDALLLVPIWPMYAPVLLLASGDRDGERQLLRALGRAASTPLGSILPDAATGRALGRRLRAATARLRDIDAVLARPDFDAGAAQLRIAELTERGAPAGVVATAELRVQTIERVRGLRQRFAAELDEVRELVAQLVAQAELVRLAGSGDDAATELVHELVARVEGLDHLMETGGDLVCSPTGAPNPGGR
jgi:hypothetical protein